jgi:hypothetical protein
MRLTLTKSAPKGIMGGVTFEIRAQVRLEADESQLIDAHKLQNQVVLEKKAVNIWGNATEQTISVTAAQLIRGERFACKNLGEVLMYEENLIRAGQTLKLYLETARGFGHEIVVDLSGSNRARAVASS